MGTDPSLTHDTCKSSDYFVGYLQLQSFLLPLHLPFERLPRRLVAMGQGKQQLSTVSSKYIFSQFVLVLELGITKHF